MWIITSLDIILLGERKKLNSLKLGYFNNTKTNDTFLGIIIISWKFSLHGGLSKLNKIIMNKIISW